MKIRLSSGNDTLVDEEYYPWLNRWNWHEHGSGYAIRRVGNPGKIVWMHRLINDTPEGYETDHINRNRLDNRKINLRTVTRSENILNSKTRRDNKSGHKGVYWIKDKRRWLAYISKDKKFIKIATFKTKPEAIMARQSVELQLND